MNNFVNKQLVLLMIAWNIGRDEMGRAPKKVSGQRARGCASRLDVEADSPERLPISEFRKHPQAGKTERN